MSSNSSAADTIIIHGDDDDAWDEAGEPVHEDLRDSDESGSAGSDGASDESGSDEASEASDESGGSYASDASAMSDREAYNDAPSVRVQICGVTTALTVTCCIIAVAIAAS